MKTETRRTPFVDLFLIKPDPLEKGNFRFSTEKTDIQLDIAARSDKPLLDSNFVIAYNGRVLSGMKWRESPLRCIADDAGIYTCVFRRTLPLVEGANVFSVSAKNTSGTATLPKIEINCLAEKPNLYVLSIGVPQSDLVYSAKDAADFAHVWRSQEGKLFKKVNLKVLNTEGATLHDSIRDAVDGVRFLYDEQTITRKDWVIIYVSSHGFLDEFGSFNIAASDYSPTLQKTWINFKNEVVRRLMPIGCRKLLFVDACKSGGVTDEAADNLGQKLMEAMTDKPVQNFHFILSNSATEFSYEDAEWQNGAFTKAILEAFDKPKTADTNSDNKLVLNELYQYLRQRVPSMVKAKKGMLQTPQLVPLTGETVDIFKF